MNAFKTIDKCIAKIIEVLLIASIYVMAIFLMANIISRNFFKASIASTDEIGKYCIVIMTFVALAYIAQHDKHVKIALLYDILPWKYKRWMSTVIYIISAVIIGYIAYVSFGYVEFTIASARTSSVLAIPISYVAIAMFVGFVLLSLEYIIEAIMNIASHGDAYTGRNKVPRVDSLESKGVEKNDNGN